MNTGLLEGQVRRLSKCKTFTFACHPGVGCFTECCRELDLALTPYDVIRLKLALSLSSNEFLDRYAVIEQEEDDPFPYVYLGMKDDGRGSCPFVSASGCTVYSGRPGACRMYPLGRAAHQGPKGEKKEYYVLVEEPHCRGLLEPRENSTTTWIEEQGLLPYNEANDEVMEILQHEGIKNGLKLYGEQRDQFLLALYDPDRFRAHILARGPDVRMFSTKTIEEIAGASETDLLSLGIEWLKKILF